MSDSDDLAGPVIVAVRGSKKVQITLTVSASLLARVDEVASRKAISRDAMLRLLISDGLAKWEAA
jgi:hypothetical protein